MNKEIQAFCSDKQYNHGGHRSLSILRRITSGAEPHGSPPSLHYFFTQYFDLKSGILAKISIVSYFREREVKQRDSVKLVGFPARM